MQQAESIPAARFNPHVKKSRYVPAIPMEFIRQTLGVGDALALLLVALAISLLTGPMAEVLPGYEMTLWQGIATPTGTPRPVINTILGAYRKVLAMPEVVKKYAEGDTDIVGSSPEEFTRRYRTDLAKFARIVKDARVPLTD